MIDCKSIILFFFFFFFGTLEGSNSQSIHQFLQHSTADTVKYTTPPEKISKVPRPSAAACGSAPSDRPYACPNEGCIKAYIDEYELKIHLRREHPGHMSVENAENAAPNAHNEMDEASDQVAYAEKRINGKSQKQSRSEPRLKMPPPKITQRKGSSPCLATLKAVKKSWPVKEETYEEEDSEETEEEDRDNAEDG
ncbi:zinc finger transcription factor YY1-like [Hevea brasiliensis]|uniref:zinc finger transcription factor YY1-like n=1 Tax=Hevea brasiliensis TaxID=3981 RepID=UPI0025E7FA09|nr:zinc finger transcription factor YY1-like [Hevea brasiliensis]